MFDNRWDNWAGDFAESFAVRLLDPAARDYASDILIYFGEAVRTHAPDFPDEVAPGAFARALTEGMPRLNLPEEARRHVPEVIAAFLENLGDTGRLGDGHDWAAQVRILGKSYLDRLKPDGGVKGVPIRKAPASSPLGRNDPCPCGSGKKYKKCCLGR